MTAGDATGDEHLTVEPPEQWATGVPAVRHALEFSLEHTSLRRTALNLLTINQPTASTARAAHGRNRARRHLNEYCENGAKARQRRGDHAADRPGVLPRAPRLRTGQRKSDMWLNQQGRLTEPMVKRAGRDHYEPIAWDDAFELLADRVARARTRRTRRCSTPRGGPSNEAAFLSSCSCAASAPTTCPTAPTCATSPAASALQRDHRHRQGHRQPRRHRTRPT